MGCCGCYAYPLLETFLRPDDGRQHIEVAAFGREERREFQFDGVAEFGQHVGIILERSPQLFAYLIFI